MFVLVARRSQNPFSFAQWMHSKASSWNQTRHIDEGTEIWETFYTFCVAVIGSVHPIYQ